MICKDCKKDKPITDYYKSWCNKGGYQKDCKQCHIAKVRTKQKEKPKRPREPRYSLPPEAATQQEQRVQAYIVKHSKVPTKIQLLPCSKADRILEDR